MRLYRRKMNDWNAERKMSDWGASPEMNAKFAAKEHLIDEWETKLYDLVRWWRAWWWIWSSDRWRANDLIEIWWLYVLKTVDMIWWIIEKFILMILIVDAIICCSDALYVMIKEWIVHLSIYYYLYYLGSVIKPSSSQW